MEEMAEKGWMIEKVGHYMAKFRAVEPKRLKFYVDVYEEGNYNPERKHGSAFVRRYRLLNIFLILYRYFDII